MEIRASTLSRIMSCLGPVTLKELAENVEGEPAREGTAFGELVTHMINQRTANPQVNRTAANGVIFDEDMWFYARDMYANLVAKAEGALITSELRIDWAATGTIIVRGQYDSSFLKGDTLYVDDAKYGYGLVEVKKNWQLIAYAVGLAIKYNWQFNNVSLTIHQPRTFHEDGPIRTWNISKDELFQLAQEICIRMADLEAGRKTLATGKHCKYCLGANTCPALTRATQRAVDFVLEDWNERALTNEDINQMLQMFERAADLIKIKHESLQNLAISKLQQNQVIGNYSFEPKFGDRTWKPGVSIESIKALSNVDISKQDIMSPNQAEKAGVNKKLVAQLTMRKNIGVKLIQTNALQKAQEVFKKVEG